MSTARKKSTLSKQFVIKSNNGKIKSSLPKEKKNSWGTLKVWDVTAEKKIFGKMNFTTTTPWVVVQALVAII